MSDDRGYSLGPPAIGGIQGGPAAGQFLGTLQQILQALNSEIASQNALLNAFVGNILSQLKLSEITTPATPASGFVVYVDSVDHKLKAKGSSGTITILANP